MTPSEFIIGPQLPIGSTWFDTTQVTKGRIHAAAFPDIPPANLDPYILAHYYDFGLTQDNLHARTNDPQDLANAKRITDSWWKMAWIDEGRRRPWPDDSTPAPRHAGIGGLILRAQDRPEMWDWINSYTKFSFDLWLKRRINNAQLYLGTREGAFMLHYAAWLAKALPDSFPLQAGGTETNGAQLRAEYLADVEDIAVNYFGRLQYPDGSWRADDPYYTDADGGHLVGVMQPFMIGLLLNALIDVHRLTTNETVKISIQNQITKACRHLYSDGPYIRQVVPTFGVEIRGFQYFYHGGTTVNPTKYARGIVTADYDTTDRGHIEGMRQAIGPILTAYAYAYFLTQDKFFLDAFNELFNSAYSGDDGFRAWANGDAKSYNQHYRMNGRALVWRESAAPTPTPATRKVAWPKQEGKQKPVLDAQWAERYRLQDTAVWGDWAIFEKVP